MYEKVPPEDRRLSVEGRRISVVDDIFGEIKEGGPNYRNVSVELPEWQRSHVLIYTDRLARYLSADDQNTNWSWCPLDTLSARRMDPGLVMLIVIGVITTWSNYMIGVFKKNHPSVYSIDDVGFLLFGRWGREFFYGAFLFCKLNPTPLIPHAS